MSKTDVVLSSGHPAVSILLPTHNRADQLEECLKALMATNYPRFEVVVVMAACTDNTTEVLSHFSSTRVRIVSAGDIGYGEAVNVGIAVSRGDLLVSYEDDYVCDPEWLEPLVNQMLINPATGITGGKVLFYSRPSTILAAGGRINTVTGGTKCISNGKNESQSEGTVMDVDYVPVPLVRREVYERIGLWDPEYFLLFDETDLCLRAKQAGYKVRYVSSSRLWHKVPDRRFLGTPKRVYYYFRNRLRFVLIHSPTILLSPGIMFNLALMLAAVLGFSARREKGQLKAIWNSLKWNLGHLEATMASRRQTSLSRRNAISQDLTKTGYVHE